MMTGGLLLATGKIAKGNVFVRVRATLELFGVFTLVGNLTVDVGGTLQVDVNGGTFGSMTATGSATLDRTLTVYIPPAIPPMPGMPPANNVPVRGTKRTIISAAGGANRPTVDPADWKTTALNANDIELEKL